jgi:hypothetical protein
MKTRSKAAATKAHLPLVKNFFCLGLVMIKDIIF